MTTTPLSTVDRSPSPSRVAVAGRAAVLLGITYVLSLGGTYTGLLHPDLRMVSLVLLSGSTAGWLAWAWWRPVGGLRHLPLWRAGLAWTLALAVSLVDAPWGRASLGLWFMTLYGGLWLVLVDLRQRGLSHEWLIDGLLLALVPLLLLAVMQGIPWYLDYLALDGVSVAFVPPRPPSTLGTPNALGTVIALALPFAGVRLGRAGRWQDRLLWGAWCTLAGFVLVLTYSRGAWLATAGAIGTLTLFGWLRRGTPRSTPLTYWRILRPQHRLSLLAAALAVLIILGALILGMSGAFDTPRRGTSARLDAWVLAWDLFRQQPLTGAGLFSYGRHYSGLISFPPEQPHPHAHNLPLNVLSEMGLPGAAALLISVIEIGRAVLRGLRRAPTPRAHWHTAAGAAALIAFGLHSLVDMTLLIPAVFVTLLVILFATVPLPVQQHAAHNAPPWRSLARYGRPLLASGLWLAVLVSGWWAALHYRDYVAAERALLDRRWSAAVTQLQASAAAQPELAWLHAEHGYGNGLWAYHEPQRADVLQNGIAAYERALRIEPQHAIWWANLAALHWQAGQPDAAIIAMKQATTRAPDAPDFWLNLGRFYELDGQPTAARRAYIQVLDLNPAYGEARFFTETSLRRAVLADTAPEPTPYTRAVHLWDTGQPAAALSILDSMLETDPSQPRPYALMARLLVRGGDLERAAAHLDAARLLVHTDHDRAWIEVIAGELAAARGDAAAQTAHMQRAREWLWPQPAGYAILYGVDVAHLQFFHITTESTLLPQLVILGPYPALTDLLTLPE